MPILRPLHQQRSAGQLHDSAAFEKVGHHARDQRRARAGAAGERLSCAALPDFDFDFGGAENLREMNVRAGGENGMIFDLRSDGYPFYILLFLNLTSVRYMCDMGFRIVMNGILRGARIQELIPYRLRHIHDKAHRKACHFHRFAVPRSG